MRIQKEYGSMKWGTRTPLEIYKIQLLTMLPE
jgi:hypothetical protein